jgi:hypothetical protein
MPHFDEFYASKLRGGLGVTDAAPKSVAVRLDPPAEGGGETLFQPVGKALLDAKKRGWIDRLQTLPAQDGLGFYVVLAGKPEREG